MTVETPMWSAIVLAGQRPGGDAMADRFAVPSKACVPFAGKPLAAWVIETLLATPGIGPITILAQTRAMLDVPEIAALLQHDRVSFAPSVGGISQSISHIIGKHPSDWPVFITTADHPLLTPDIVAEFLERANASDLSVGVVERITILQRYPQSRRTWLKFRGGAYSGANLFALRSPATLRALDSWSRAEQDRKQTLKLFWHFGPLLAVRAITRTISFANALHTAGRKMGLDAALVLLRQPEAAIDVDKPSDHELAQSIVLARNQKTNTQPAATKPMMSTISIFDLDRTLTRRPTYTALLAYMAWHIAPWRLFSAPFILIGMLGYVCGIYSRRRVKEMIQWFLLGNRVPSNIVDNLARKFATRLDAGGFFDSGRAAIAQDKAAGRRIILATAANQFYANAIAEQLGIADVVATRSVWHNSGLMAKIDGENCYGLAKRDMVAAYIAAQNIDRDTAHIRVYSDHISDMPTFDWANEQIVVNPAAKLYQHALRKNWTIVFWM